jgi:cytochrome c-type biogenesis protein
MEAPTVGVLIAFSAGLLSFLSPCVLPLIPSYVTFITGVSLDDLGASRRTWPGFPKTKIRRSRSMPRKRKS